MNDDLSILFKAKLDESSNSINDINTQISNISRKLKSLNINIEFNDDILKSLNAQLNKLSLGNLNNKIVGNFNKELENTDKSLKKISETSKYFNNELFSVKEAKEYKDELGNILKTISEIDKNGNIKENITLTDNLEKVQKLKDDFNKKNINAIDYEILKREELGRINSNLIRQQMEEQARLTKELDKQNTLEREIAITKQNLNNRLKDITVKNDKYDTDELEKLKVKINEVTADTPKAKLRLKELSSEITQFGIKAKESSSTTNSFSDSLKRFLTFYSLHDVISTTKRVVRELVDTVYDLSESLLEIQKVSDLTGKSLDSFINQAYKIGDKLSKTGKDVIDATTIFKRAGYDLGESTYLAKNAIIMQSVAENIKDVETAGTSLISVLKGYNFEIEKSSHVVDAFNQVSNTQAVNFDNLVEGASRISAVMKQQGNSFEEMIGLLTGATEVLGSGSIERVSTQLRTLALRLASMNEETGKFEPEIISELNDEFERLAGISLVDENKQIKSTYEIMKDMAKVMPTLDKNTRSYLMELASGKRGMETMEAIMTNWKNVEKATDSAINSYGSSADEFDKYTNSILGKTEKLKGALQELSVTSLSSDFIAVILDATTAVIKLTTACGGLVPVIISVVSAFALLNWVKLSNTFKILGESITLIGLDFANLFKNIVSGATSATVALSSLTVASKVLLGVGIVAGIMGVIYVFNKLNVTLDEQKKKVQEAQTAYQELTSELNELNEQLATINDRIRELQIKGTLTLIEKDELSNLQKTNYELQRRKELLEAEEKIKAKSVNKEVKKAYDKEFGGYNRVSSVYSEYSTLEDKGLFSNLKITEEEYYKRVVQRYAELDKLGKDRTKSQEKEYKSLQEYIIKTSNEFEDYASKVSDANEEGKKLKNTFLDLSDSAFKVLSPDLWKDNKLTELFNQDDFAKIKTELIELSKAGKLDENAVKSYTKLNTAIENVGVTAEDVVAIINDIPKASDNINEIIGSIKDNLTKVEDATNNFEDNINSLATVYRSLSEGQDVEYSTLTKLISEYPKYAIALSKINENKQEGITLVKTLFEAQKKETEEFLKQTKAKIIAEQELLKARQAQIGKSTRITQEQIDNYEKIKSYQEAIDVIKAYENTIEQSSIKTFAGKGSSSSTNKSILEPYEKRKKEIKHEIFLSKQLQATYKETSKEYIAEQEKQYAKYLELQELASSTRKNLNISPTSDEGMTFSQDWWSAYNDGIDTLQDKLKSITLSYEEQNQLLEDRLKLLDIEQSKYNKTDPQYKSIEQEKYNVIVAQEELLAKKIKELRASNIKGANDEAKELEKIAWDLMQKRIEISKNFKSIDSEVYQNEIETIEKTQSAISKLESAYMAMRKRQLNETKKMYQDEIKMVDNVYNAKKKALQKERDDRYAKRETEDKTKAVSDIQSQLDLIKNDETQIAKRIQLEEELAKAKQELDDNLYDTQYEKQMQSLEDDQERIKEKYQMEIDALDEYLSDETAMREEFYRNLKNNSQIVYKQLIEDAEKYGKTTSIDIKNAWDTCTESLTNFGTKQLDVNRELDNMATKLYEIQSLMQSLNSMSLDDYSSSIGKSTSSNMSLSKESINSLVNNVATKAINAPSANNIASNVNNNKSVQVNQGNIVVNGNADSKTVKDIDKALKKNNEELLKQVKQAIGTSRGNSYNLAW